MSEQTHWSDGVVLPALLRAARGAYGGAIRAALENAGYDDVPKNGVYVIGAMARLGAHAGAPLSDIIKEIGVSKQAAGQLVDTLVARGYLDRTVDAEDRRRLTVMLTERGRAAAMTSRAAIETVDGELLACVGPEFIAHARRVLAALAVMGRDRREKKALQDAPD